MEKFSYRCGAVTLQFGVSEEGCPCLLYAGTYPAARREEEALGRYAAEVQLSGENHGEHHFSKHYRSSETPSLRYAGHRVQAHADGEELIVTSRNSRITAESHYRFSGARRDSALIPSSSTAGILPLFWITYPRFPMWESTPRRQGTGRKTRSSGSRITLGKRNAAGSGIP